MRRVIVKLDGDGPVAPDGFAILLPDIAEGVRIERRQGQWFAELELPKSDGLTTELYALGRVEPFAATLSDREPS